MARFPLKKRGWLGLAGVGIMAACGSDDDAIATSASSGFSLQESAFAFQNFASGYSDSRMTPALVARMYGAENVCANKATPCELTPSATAWMNKVNGSMNGGRCEGFAVLSSLFFTGALEARNFGAPTAYQLKLEGNLALQEELAYWFATQSVEATTESTTKHDATDSLRFLGKFLGGAREGGEFYRIGMVRKTKKGITGGHALTPMYYEPAATAGVYYVHVYDNNFPAQDRYITIDTNKNRWEYTASTNPKDTAALYYGDDANKNYLYFAPVRNRLGKLTCKFCKGGSAKKYVVVDGADVTAKGKSGKTAGVKGGNIDESGGAVVPSFSAETWTNSAPLTLIMEPGETTFEVSASNTSTTTTASVSEFGPGYSAEAKHLTVTSAADSFTVGEGGANVTFDSKSGTAVALSSAIETASGNVVQVEVQAPAGASQATASIDKMTGAVEAKTQGAEGQPVTLVVTKVDAMTGQTQTGVVTATAGATNTLSADTAAWKMGATLEVKQDKGDGMPPVVLRDGCGNGTQDGTETDVDCGGACTTKCADNLRCSVAADCAIANCDANSRCTAPISCTDGIKNGSETDLDCGGSCATKCAQGKACSIAADCVINACTSNVCDTADRVVFVTSTTYDGNLGGIAGGDAKCQARATAAGLYGTFKALLADGTTNSKTRLAASPGRYVRVDGVAIANDDASFWSNVHLAGISVEEMGTNVGSVNVHTGSDALGVGGPANNSCLDWSTNAAGNIGMRGVTSATNNSWINQSQQACNLQNHLYCVRQ